MKYHRVEFTVKGQWLGANVPAKNYLTTKQIHKYLASIGFKDVCLHYISGLVKYEPKSCHPFNQAVKLRL